MSGTDEPPREPEDAVGHLQVALLELVAAARSALDAVEKVVKDPQGLAPLVATAGALGQVVIDLVRQAASPAEPAPPPGRSDAARRPVEHIPVS